MVVADRKSIGRNQDAGTSALTARHHHANNTRGNSTQRLDSCGFLLKHRRLGAFLRAGRWTGNHDGQEDAAHPTACAYQSLTQTHAGTTRACRRMASLGRLGLSTLSTAEGGHPTLSCERSLPLGSRRREHDLDLTLGVMDCR